MSNQLTPQLQPSSIDSAPNVTINLPEPADRSFADLIWIVTPVLTIVVVGLCLLILYQLKGGSPPLSGAGSDGSQPGSSQQEESQSSDEEKKPERPDAESSNIGKLTVAEFVTALQDSDNSRQQITALLESLGKPVEASDRGDKSIGDRVKTIVGRFREMSDAEATLKQLEAQVDKRKQEKNDLELQLEQAKKANQKLDGEITGLRNELAKILDENGVSAETKTQLLQARDASKQLDNARKQMLVNLEVIAAKQSTAAVKATNDAWTSRMNWISRMTNVIPVRRQRLVIVIPLIDRQSYESVKAAVEPLENEFLTWETKFDGLEIWCFVMQGDRDPELCRWPPEYDRDEGRNLWAISGTTGNQPPTQVKYPLVQHPLRERQAEKYLFVLPLDGASDDITAFPFPPESTFDVVLVHDRNYADLQANEREFANQFYYVQKSAGVKLESLSVLPSKEGKAPEFQAKLRQLVRGSAIVMGEMEIGK